MLRRVGAGLVLGDREGLQPQLAARRCGGDTRASARRCRGAGRRPSCTSARGRRRSEPPERLISSMTMLASVRPSPRPPYSVGISAASSRDSVSASTNSCGYSRAWSRRRQYASGKPAQRSRTCPRSSWWSVIRERGLGGLAPAEIADQCVGGDEALVFEERGDETVLGHRRAFSRARVRPRPWPAPGAGHA